MGLTLNLFFTILVELPIITLFFRRKKRLSVLGMALVINVISWVVAHAILFNTGINIYYVAIGVMIGEGIAFSTLLECGWKKGFVISLLVNTLSFFITQVLLNEYDLFNQHTNLVPGGKLSATVYTVAAALFC